MCVYTLFNTNPMNKRARVCVLKGRKNFTAKLNNVLLDCR